MDNEGQEGRGATVDPRELADITETLVDLLSTHDRAESSASSSSAATSSNTARTT
jgi:hypothetical protein